MHLRWRFSVVRYHYAPSDLRCELFCVGYANVSALMFVACQGDMTSGGGCILDGDLSFTVDGLPVAYEGARALCHVHGLTHIAEATMPAFVGGGQVACDGDKLACGHHIMVQGWRRASGESSVTGSSHASNGLAAKSPAVEIMGSGTVTLPGSTFSADDGGIITLRLLCQLGRAHGGLKYIKTFEAMGGEIFRADAQGVTAALASPEDRTVLMGFEVPAMEPM